MSTIRRQSIISSVVVYIGFALGFFNTYLFTRQGGFTKEQYGLTAVFIAAAQLIYAISSLGMASFINKFFPYYKAHLPDRKNDQLTWALFLPCVGFLLVVLLGIIFKDIIINKVLDNSPDLLRYYYWIFPFGFGYTIFLVLEAYAWQQRKAVLSNFLKEVGFRLCITVLIVLTTVGLIHNFSLFISLFSLIYILLAFYILFFFSKKRKLHFTFQKSIVTKKFQKKITGFVVFIWAGGLVFNLATVFDTIVIAAVLPNGVGEVAFFTFAQNISSLIQAPQRAIISAAVGPLSQAWREKNLAKINQIYHRSSINQLLFSCAMFALVWLNFEDGIYTFNLQSQYTAAKIAFLYLGITRIVDMGFGVNAQIIGTSTFWRFEFVTGLILLLLIMPLSYFLVKAMGIMGPAVASLISLTIYNLIRFVFLYRKFKMQPFNLKTVYTILLAAFCFTITLFLFREHRGIQWIVLRSMLFTITFALGTIYLKLSPDVMPVWETIRKRLRL
ncbi:MAG: lipopolysaccharide biosynthesis protein [Chitinophagaceae bacterium]|nr:MAG: lipopolysaccharide biosynthesis protein [Chitinophagaceae bacterium]